MTNLPPSNFTLLKATYASIISKMDDGDKRARSSSTLVQRKTIHFKDKSVMYCCEFLEQINTAVGNEVVIDRYYYDWEDENGDVLLKFHSEPHRGNNYRTSTEPFHIHPSNPMDGRDRFANYRHRDLMTMEFIQGYLEIADIKRQRAAKTETPDGSGQRAT